MSKYQCIILIMAVIVVFGYQNCGSSQPPSVDLGSHNSIGNNPVGGGNVTISPFCAGKGVTSNPSFSHIIQDARFAAEAVNSQFPGLINTACLSQGGNTAFLNEVIKRLRLKPEYRWGYNYSNIAPKIVTNDTISFFWDDNYPGSVEGANSGFFNIKVIENVCGNGTRSPAAIDTTELNCTNGKMGYWTLEPCFTASPNCYGTY